MQPIACTAANSAAVLMKPLPVAVAPDWYSVPAGTFSLTTMLRRELRAAAGEPDREVIGARVRPIVDAACDELRGWRLGGASEHQLSLVWTGLVDAAVLECYRVARLQSRLGTIVAPLTLVAVEAYGEQALLPAQHAKLLSIVPSDRREHSGRRMWSHLAKNLQAIGLMMDHEVATPATLVGLVRSDPNTAVTLSTGRHLVGPYGPWAAMREHVAG